MTTKQPPFKYIYYVLPDKNTNESLAASYENIGGTKTQTVTRRPATFDHDVDLWIVTKTQLSILYSMQKDVSEKLFDVFVQKRKDGQLTPYKKPRILVPRKKPTSIQKIIEGGIVQTASSLSKVFYVAGKEMHDSFLKRHAKEHDLQMNQLALGKDKMKTSLVFYTASRVRMEAFLNDKALPDHVKEHIKKYVGGPGGKPVMCNDDFIPL